VTTRTAVTSETSVAAGIRRPAPVLNEDNAAFWQECREHRLTAQACGHCARLRHPPRPMCPHCGSTEVIQRRLSGGGTVYSYAVLHHPQAPQFDYPVTAALIELDEGVRLLSNLVGVAPADLRIGLPVQVEFAETVDGWAVPVFSATTEANA
jgi:uncharacterized OB-fold protein